MAQDIGLSVIIPVTERYESPQETFDAYRISLERLEIPLEFIYVIDGRFSDRADEFRRIWSGSYPLKLVVLSRTFGESSALAIGFQHARHDLLMTLPAYAQVEASAIPTLMDRLQGADMVVACRWPRQDAKFNQMTSRVFHGLIRGLASVSFRDLGCGVRLIRREVLEEISVYGDQHRFLPILAERRGFQVSEVDLHQASSERKLRVYQPGVYVSRLLDLLGVFFVVRFTKKPLRFFGMVGSTLLTLGGIILVSAVAQRFFLDLPLSERPILLLGSLLVVLGVQLFALGLIGELIIFTHARELKEYAVAETINMDGVQGEQLSVSGADGSAPSSISRVTVEGDGEPAKDKK